MYSNQNHINSLTRLLVAHGVRHAVLCPGSRNAPIVHNLNACNLLRCYAVTDERSAGFYALGLSLMSQTPVAICVTSGTALLNVLPAVAEAWHQHVPLIIISADRPTAWIGQQDGQTLQQPGSLAGFVGCTVDIETPLNDETRWLCNRRLNEALIRARQGGGAPVHINLHIAEPLYDFSASELPAARTIAFHTPLLQPDAPLDCPALQTALSNALRPVVVMGQQAFTPAWNTVMARLQTQGIVVLCEPLACDAPGTPVDALMALAATTNLALPDFILYIGGTIVSKRLKEYLRRATNAACWVVNEDGAVYDTFQNLQGVVQASPIALLRVLTWQGADTWQQAWSTLARRVETSLARYVPPFSSLHVVQCFERLLMAHADKPVVHYANSMAVRMGCLYAQHYVYCNRGVNGIEGSLSTAAGQSLATDDDVFCVIGDLSFFYDHNALWNRHLRGNLRILLLNNGGGAIFGKFAGLRASDAREPFVMGAHHTSAKGICAAYGVVYHAATSPADCAALLPVFIKQQSRRPVLLEVFTNSETDACAYEDLFRQLTTMDDDRASTPQQ